MAAAATRIELCGRLLVEWRGERIEHALRGRQGRLLFAFLVLERGRPVRRDAVVGAVWPEDAPAGSDANLAPLLSRLRRAVGPGHLEGRTELQLVLPEDARVDWEEIGANLAAARAARARERWGDALEAARDAAATAAGGLLPGLEADWLEPRRAELEAQRLEALELSARAGVALGGDHEVAEARDAAAAAVAAAPFRESARAALMEALRAQGNPSEALRAFEDLRVLLRDELGTTPGPELLGLHEALLRDLDEPPKRPARRPGGLSSVLPEAPAVRAPVLPDLVERDRELAELGALLAEATAGEARVALIAGAAGVGKTRLLGELRRRARHEALVVGARAGELERDLPFDVVRQLFEGELADPARHEALLRGAAAPARAVFAAADGSAAGDGPADDASSAVLHGLFWLALNLAAERPLVLLVDDLHWCDRPSLRFLAYLVRRFEGVPVLLAATLRTGEAATDALLLDELVNDPATVPVRPGPLSLGAVRVLVRARLGAEASEELCVACHETTQGNALLLRQLLVALVADAVPTDASGAAVARRIGPRAVSRSVAVRLARTSATAVEVARAVAVLGERGELPVVAALAGISEGEASDAVSALVRADVLRPEAPLAFVHPLVRDAVLADLAPGEREARHARAARVLADAGAPVEELAVHLLATARRGDPWVADRLHEAGSLAARRGAPDVAVAHLERALEEPVPPEHRADLLLELGMTEASMSGPRAAERLRAALAELTDPHARATAAYTLGRVLFLTGGAEEAMSVSRAAAQALPPEADLRYALWCNETQTAHSFGDQRRVAELMAEPVPHSTGAGARLAQGLMAFLRSVSGAPADPCVALALESVSDDRLAEIDHGIAVAAALVPLALADREEAVSAWDRVAAVAARRGSYVLDIAVHMWRGWTRLRRGDLAAAEDELTYFRERAAEWGVSGGALAYDGSFHAEVLLGRGEVTSARRALDSIGPLPRGTEPERLVLCARAQLALAEDDPAAALEAALGAGASAGMIVHPIWLPWRGLAAAALTALGRREEAVALTEEELVHARAWGTPSAVGRVLRTLGEAAGGDAGRAHLRESVAALDGSVARLELARSLAAYGRAQLGAGERDEARDLLRRALAEAERCAAEPLASEVRGLLAQLGVAHDEPRRVVLLTDLERRVAREAARGLEVRGIAEATFLTPVQAERLLAAARAKLDAGAPEDADAELREADRRRGAGAPA